MGNQFAGMIRVVKKSKHRFRPAWPWLVFRRHINYTITFLPSCRYDIGPDQADWNKLFGVGFFPHHHRNSYRFGWRYNIDTGLIEISAYWYDNGVRRSSAVLRNAKINQPVILALEYKDGAAVWKINDSVSWAVTGNWPLIGYKLGPYFGGNQSAPHNMKIEMK